MLKFEEGFNAKRNGFISSRDRYLELTGGHLLLKWLLKLKDNEMIKKSKKHLAYNNRMKPLKSFSIANNLLTPITKATNLGI